MHNIVRIILQALIASIPAKLCSLMPVKSFTIEHPGYPAGSRYVNDMVIKPGSKFFATKFPIRKIKDNALLFIY